MPAENKYSSAVVTYIVDGEEKQEKKFDHWIKAVLFIEGLCKKHESKKDLIGLATTGDACGYFGRVTHVDGEDKATTWEVWPYGWK